MLLQDTSVRQQLKTSQARVKALEKELVSKLILIAILKSLLISEIKYRSPQIHWLQLQHQQ